MTFKAFLVFLPLLIAGASVEAQDDWELAKDKDGIQVYTRTPGGSDVKEFKARTTVNANVGVLEEIMFDVDAYTTWQSNTSESRKIEVVSKLEEYLYIVTDVPWPIKDRDLVLHSLKQISPDGKVTITLLSAPDKLAKTTRAIRMEEAAGSWAFTPLSDTETEVFYTFFGDPSGSIPNWIINMFIVDGPFKTLTNLRKIAEHY